MMSPWRLNDEFTRREAVGVERQVILLLLMFPVGGNKRLSFISIETSHEIL
jgi:hypothetical protein